MDNLTEDYAKADRIYEEYEALLWDIIKDVKADESLLKLAGKLQEASEWENED